MVKFLLQYGKVAEWLKAPLSKSGMGVISSRVRIPPFPQNNELVNIFYEKGKSQLLGFCGRFEYGVARFIF